MGNILAITFKDKMEKTVNRLSAGRKGVEFLVLCHDGQDWKDCRRQFNGQADVFTVMIGPSYTHFIRADSTETRIIEIVDDITHTLDK